MLPFFLLLQVPTAQPAPAGPPPPPIAAPPPGYEPSGAYPPPGYAPYPAPQYPYGYPPGYAPPGYAYPQPKPERPPEPDREVAWFVRVGVGLGPPAFSGETQLLHLEGYGGAKLWVTGDGGYMFHPNIGAGAWAGLSFWSSSPGHAPQLTENGYFVGGELPIKLGSRSASLLVLPRIGYASGQVQIGGDAPFQSAFAYGLELSATSFRYHITGALGFVRAPVGRPGDVGRNHDYGGFYALVGGTFDG